jgi:uncharacterized protein YegP (UPF0339 family)
MGKFVIKKRINGEFQFNLKAANGEIILTSEGYNGKAGCQNGIESVRKNAPDDNRYDRKIASNGQYYFNLTATNGQVIGTSERYNTSSSRDGGIESVKRNAPTAIVEDNS